VYAIIEGPSRGWSSPIVLGYDPLGAGLRSVPFAVVLLVVANTTPRVVRWAGTRAVIPTGPAVVAVSMLGRASFTVHTGYPAILVTQCVFAFGMGLTIAPATASIMGAVPAGRAGVGSAINETTRQVGGALGVAVMGSLGASVYRHSATHALAGANLPAAISAKALDSVGAALAATRSPERRRRQRPTGGPSRTYVCQPPTGVPVAQVPGSRPESVNQVPGSRCQV
jgi:hypothetical protein